MIWYKGIRVFTAVGSVLLLNLLLSLYRILPSGQAVLAFLPVPEIIVLFAPLLIAALRGRTSGIGAVHLSAGLGTALSAYGIGEGAIRMLYARAWEPVGDYPLMRGAILLFFPGDGIMVDIAALAALLTAVTILYAVFFFSLREIAGVVQDALAEGVRSQDFAALSAALIAAAIAGLAVTGPQQSLSAAAVGVLHGDDFAIQSIDRPEMARSTESENETSESDASVEEAALESSTEHDTTEPPDYQAPGFKDRDVYVFIIESYGITVFDRDRIRESVQPKLEEVQTRLSDDGFHSISNFLESPIFGGQSWLAEATFLSGNRIDRQGRYEQLIEEGSDTILQTLSDMADYYSVAIKPGSINGGWTHEQEVFGFDEVLTAYDGYFEYEGPWFSFVPVPDQFAIWTAHNRIRELRQQDGNASGRPLYLHYQLVSSHLPFNRIPEVIDDWSELGDGSLYHESDNQYFDNDYFRGDEYLEGYSAGINYVLEIITQYMIRHVAEDDGSLFIVYGDHQPGTVVTGHGASNSVPIHILSRDRELLQAWREDYAFIPGLIPDQAPPHIPMANMFPIMAEVASEEP